MYECDRIRQAVILPMFWALLPCRAALAIDSETPSGNLSSERPNIVVVMVDDMGYGDAGCYGGTAFATPNLDRLAAEGMRFTDFHSNSCVCSPTRAALMTGRYQQRAGIPGVVYAAPDRNRHHGLQMVERTLPEALADSGYATGMFGKWHLGYEEQYNPIHQGFQEYIGYVSGNVDFHTHIDGAGVFDWWKQNQHSREEGYTTHLITRHACDFIKTAAATEDNPFFLYVAHEAPHDPYQGPNDKPVRREGENKLAYDHRELKHAQRAYAEMMVEMDKGIGEILSTLKSSNADENTFVMFFSDNGATGPGSCGELYGMKGTLWEGGHRVPCMARWPGRIDAGSSTNQLACTMDVMPTLLDFAGIDNPTDRPLDGISLTDFLLNNSPQFDRQLFWQYGDAVCMRSGARKMVINGGKPSKKKSDRQPNINWNRPNDGRENLAVFDLDDDLAEESNLAQNLPDIEIEEMKRAIRRWQKDVANGATQQPKK